MNNLKRKWSTGSPGPKFVDQKPRVALAIFNPQFDLCHSKGKSFISGADDDMKNLASFIASNSACISKIFISLDNYKMWSYPSDEYHSCLTGSFGASIVPTIETAVYEKHCKKNAVDPFVIQRFANDWNQRNETSSSKAFVNFLKDYDEILIAGEALNFQILSFLEFWNQKFGLSNVLLLSDCSSEVVNEQYEVRKQRLNSFVQNGLTVTSTKEYKF